MVMPDELTHLAEDGVNRVKGCGPIDFRFEPPPEAFKRIILGGIRRQVFKGYPVVLREKAFDHTTLVHRGIIQDQDQQGRGKALMELMQKLQKALGRAPGRALPIEVLRAQMQRAKQGGTLALRWRRDFARLALATPAAVDVGFIGEMRFIDKKDFYRPLRMTDADGSDNFCHPGFFSAALGALRGTVWAKRL